MYMPPEPEKFNFKNPNCAQSLCELVNISEKYQILELNSMAKTALENLSVTEENLVFTVMTAKNFSMFEDVSRMLMNKCQSFLLTKLISARDVFSFIMKTREAFPDADMGILYDLLKSLNGGLTLLSLNNIMSLEVTITRIKTNTMSMFSVVSDSVCYIYISRQRRAIWQDKDVLYGRGEATRSTASLAHQHPKDLLRVESGFQLQTDQI